MRRLLCIAVIVAVAALAGCGKTEPPPADTTDDRTTMPEPISTEDFESGEAETVVPGSEDAPDAAPTEVETAPAEPTPEY